MTLPTIDFTRLRRDGVCLLCGLLEDEDPGTGSFGHEADCPGRLLEGAQWTAHYTYGGCNCGCCRDSRGDNTRDTLEDLAAAVARDTYGKGNPSYLDLSLTPHEDWSNELTSRAIAINTERFETEEAEEAAKAQAAAAATARARQTKALAALEAERPDLTPEAYARRRAALDALNTEIPPQG